MSNGKWAWKKPKFTKGFWVMAVGIVALVILLAVVRSGW